MTNNQKSSTVPPDQLIHDQLDQVNKKQYYKAVESELREICKAEGSSEAALEEEMAKYIDSFRNYYYTSEILSNSKSNEFFEEVVRQLHPTVKLKGPTKSLLKTVCKVFVQELAETCFEVGSLTGRNDLQCDVVADAYRLMEKRRPKKNNVGQLFGHMHN